MSQPRRRVAALQTLVDLRRQLAADHHRPPDALRRRDRAIGRDLAGVDLERRVAGWLTAVGGWSQSGARAAGLHALFGWGLTVVAALVGGSTSLAVFFYDGSRPVNLLLALALLLGVPTAFLCVSLLAMLPASVRARVPGLGALQDFALAVAPGGWAGWLGRMRDRPERPFARALALLRTERALYGGLERWLVVELSQRAGLAFQLAALASLLALVGVTDLAFGWSTTLRFDAAALHVAITWLALPWGWLAPDAVPSLALVEGSRFFRVGEGAVAGGAPVGVAQAEALGAWWRFVACALSVYGVTPRLLFFVFARLRLRRAVREALRNTPGLPALLERLDSPLIETAAPEPEVEAESGGAAVALGAPPPAGARCAVINWAALELSDAAIAKLLGEDLDLEATRVLHAGGARSVDDDLRAAESAARGGEEVVVVLARAWEPPVLELLDFLKDLRAAAAAKLLLAVVPLARAGDGYGPADDASLVPWQRRLQSLADPWLCLLSPRRAAERSRAS